MESREWLRRVSATCAGIVLAVLLCLIIYKIRLVVVPFAAGFVVAYILDPLLDRLEARGWSRPRAVWTIMAAFLCVSALLVVLLVPTVVDQVADAWEHRQLYSDRADRFYKTTRASGERWLGQYLPETKASEYVQAQIDQVRGWADARKGVALAWVGGRALQAGGMIVLVLLGTLIAFHFMLVIDPLRDTVERLFLSDEQSQEVDGIVERVNNMLGAYVRGMAAVSILVSIVTALVLWGLSLYFGTRYALLIGLLAGVTYAVPWIGQTVSAGTAVFFGLVTADHHAVAAAIVCGVVVIAINQVFDNVVMPRIVGDQVGLHPLVMLFAIMAGFQLWGLVGMIVAVPIAASIRIGIRRWIPILPEDEKEPKGLPRLDVGRVMESAGVALRGFMRGTVHRPADEPPGEEPPAKDESDPSSRERHDE